MMDNQNIRQRAPSSSQQSCIGRKEEIARMVDAAEQARLRRMQTAPSKSQVRAAANQRKLRRAQGIPDADVQPVPQNERKALERVERENRRKHGASGYREALIRIGLGNVDTATLLIVGLSTMFMLILPVTFIVTS